MKIEISYEIKEVIRYVVCRKAHSDGSDGLQMNWDDHCGEFEKREAAEKAIEAYDAAAQRRINKAL